MSPPDRRVALITGAAGFVGRHLIAELERETDWEIVGIATRARSIGHRATILACDLRDRELVERVVERRRPDIVVHLAAQTYVPKSFASPGDTLVNNIVGQLNVLDACRSLDHSPTIVVIGSSEEYGAVPPDELPVTERQLFRPNNPYAVSKIAQDMLALQYGLSYGMRVVRLRPFNHFGPGQSERFVLSNFARQIAECELGVIEPVILTGDLNAERDFLDVRDVARAYRLAVDQAEPGEEYNIASGIAWRIGDLLDRLISQARVNVEIRPDPARSRPSDTRRIVGDASKFRAATGWLPEIAIAASLSDTLNYWRETLGSGPTSAA